MNGIFSVKSAYEMLSNGKEVGGNMKAWQRLWKAPGIPRWKHHGWLARQEKLVTNEVKMSRGLRSDSRCDLCGHGSETTLHALRDCTIPHFGKL